MLRITRRDFLKYCSVAAGALGLSASTMMRVESVLAKSPTAPTVVWLAGAACTGCTMTLLNSVTITTAADLILDRINLKYLDTIMAAPGCKVNHVNAAIDANALTVANNVLGSLTTGENFILIVEGAIPTGTPLGGGSSVPGDFCRVGDLAAGQGADETMLQVANKFANDPNCLAIIALGTCASFGGIPAAKGNVTGAMGVAFTGTNPGGAIVSNKGTVTSVKLTGTGGSGYAAYPSAPSVTITAPSSPLGTNIRATAFATVGCALLPGTGPTGGIRLTADPLTSLTGGSGYMNNVVGTVAFTGKVVISNGGYNGSESTTIAAATATVTNGVITAVNVTNVGAGYVTPPYITFLDVAGSHGTGAYATAHLASTGKVIAVSLTNQGSGYASVPDVTIAAPLSGTTATADAKISSGAVKTRSGDLAPKVFNISGCPPHPDWIVGTIAHILDTNISDLPKVNNNFQPVDYGFGQYQCNAGPCVWRYNNSSTRPDENLRYDDGDSQKLGKYKWARYANATANAGEDMGCLGILGCKGRKTKADCSQRRWNATNEEEFGVNWCVGNRGMCHGCTEPAFPDKVGKFYTFI